MPDHVIGTTGRHNRVDFDATAFDALIERSARLVWERAAACPCASLNDQTQQPDPNCSLCDGAGVLRIGGPAGYVPDEDALGPLDDFQKAVQARYNGVIIHGFFHSATHQQTRGDTLGTWFWGETHVTVRHQNRLGYYDRLIHLDSEIPFTQLATTPAEGTALALRYIALEVSHIIDSAGVRYEQDAHFTLTASGQVLFLPGVGPTEDTTISVRYLTFPAWIVTQYPHVIRATSVKRKQARQTPQDLVLQAVVKLEFELEA